MIKRDKGAAIKDYLPSNLLLKFRKRFLVHNSEPASSLFLEKSLMLLRHLESIICFLILCDVSHFTTVTATYISQFSSSLRH